MKKTLCTTQHHKTLAAAAETDGSLDALSELRGKIVADPAAYGIDTSQGIELPASAGSPSAFVHRAPRLSTTTDTATCAD